MEDKTAKSAPRLSEGGTAEGRAQADKPKRAVRKRFAPERFDIEHLKRTEAYARLVNTLFLKATDKIANHVAGLKVDDEKVFKLKDYPQAQRQVEGVVSRLAEETTKLIRRATEESWALSYRKAEGLLGEALPPKALTAEDRAKMLERSKEGLGAFQARKVAGMNLSERVWKYTEQFKAQIEVALDVGLGEGRDAGALSRDVRQNLREPNRLFRRVRDKRGNLVLSKNARAFHPGRGVYRSSYKNAHRLARTEINMAYRQSDWERWQDLDFVVGYEVRRSSREPLYPCPLCDRLKGKYPKWFKFVGWHPNCMCHCVPIIERHDSKERRAERVDRFRRALSGEDATQRGYDPSKGAGAIKDLPEGFTSWAEEARERQAGWRSVPYFVRDNFKGGDLSKGLSYGAGRSRLSGQASTPPRAKAQAVSLQSGIISAIERERKARATESAKTRKTKG